MNMKIAKNNIRHCLSKTERSEKCNHTNETRLFGIPDKPKNSKNSRADLLKIVEEIIDDSFISKFGDGRGILKKNPIFSISNSFNIIQKILHILLHILKHHFVHME
jgi:hypothetical protein